MAQPRSNIDAGIFDSFDFAAEFTTLEDGRVRARAEFGGKTFEVFEDSQAWANQVLSDKIKAALDEGEVLPNHEMGNDL